MIIPQTDARGQHPREEIIFEREREREREKKREKEKEKEEKRGKGGWRERVCEREGARESTLHMDPR